MLPLRYKLGIYLIAFSAIMLVFLWVFQTVFLESCYTLIKQHQVKNYASKIIESIESRENTTDTINSLSRDNEMSVYVYDSTDGVMSKKYSSEFNNPSGMREINMQSVYYYYNLAKDSGGKYTANSVKNEESVEITFRPTRPATDDEAHNFISNIKNRRDKAENMIFAEIINLDDNTECFVLITALVTPVSSVIGTLHMQLAIVSAVFIIFSVVLSVIVARRISKPLDEINTGVKELAKQNYNVEFNSSGYREANELSDTLNVTRKELQNVENLRQELIANISHDLRTPLTMITGYAEVMRDLPGENTPENVQVIIDESNRLTNLVNDMLDLSKLQSGAIAIEREEFSLTDSINEIFRRYTKLIEQEGYDIQFITDRNAYVYADQIKIGQVVYNFINNAVNHCGNDKQVIVTQKASEKRVRVEVTDHGDGIDDEKLQYIWDRYYKVDKTHKRGVIGTGLGLSIVKNILDLHGARYGVKSKKGSGSTFWFELDVTRTEKLN